jgi:riboflavin kinase/FMN adenylyltransferase
VLLVRQELEGSVTPGEHALSIGVFDGVHRGHQMLLGRMIEEAQARSLTAGVITFHPHPLSVVRPDVQITYLESLERRVELLGELGLDFVSVLQFTSELQQVSAPDFCRLLVEEAGMRLIVVGEDFRLGRGGEGTVEVLTKIGEELGFEVIAVPLLGDGDNHVSSTRVREALEAGEMESVSQLLGHPFLLRGPVLHGDERGRQIGFPTLNVGVSADRWLPPNGVYVTRGHVDEREFHACTNIGVRPTFDGEPKRLVETHLLDFEGDLYGEVVTIELLHHLRAEQKFNGIEQLSAQIQRDLVATREWFA